MKNKKNQFCRSQTKTDQTVAAAWPADRPILLMKEKFNALSVVAHQIVPPSWLLLHIMRSCYIYICNANVCYRIHSLVAEMPILATTFIDWQCQFSISAWGSISLKIHNLLFSFAFCLYIWSVLCQIWECFCAVHLHTEPHPKFNSLLLSDSVGVLCVLLKTFPTIIINNTLIFRNIVIYQRIWMG